MASRHKEPRQDMTPVLSNQEVMLFAGGMYTTAQVAFYLGLTTGRVRQLSRDLGVGKLLGRDKYYTFADIDQLEARNTKMGPREDAHA